MAKETRPAMPFYGKDWYDDINVQEMSYEQHGVYLRLCWLCWTEGSIPDDTERLSRILKVADPAAFVKGFPRIRGCFNAVDGTLVHPKIETIRKELDDFRNAKSESGKLGAQARWQRHKSANGEICPSSPSSSSSSFPSASKE